MTNASKTVELTKRLIACPSVTPDDAGCQDIIRTELEKLGFNIVKLPFGDTENLWAMRGNGAPHFMFAGHTDVVPAGDLKLWHANPFSPTIIDGNLYGRGVADMKGGIAAMLIAVAEFIEQNPDHPGTISFLITSDEEGPAHNGTKKVLPELQKDQIKVDYCIVGEPVSQNRIGDTMKRGSRGSLSASVVFTGKQGHVGYAQRAKNPIHATLQTLHELTQIQWDQPSADFPATSLQITNLNAGVGAENVIPEVLTCDFNLRFSQSVTPEQIQAKIETLLKSQPLPYQIKWRLNGVPYLAPSGNLATVAKAAVQQEMQYEPTICAVGGTSDARFIMDLGCEILELGLMDTTMHAVNENVACEDLDTLTRIYLRVLQGLLK